MTLALSIAAVAASAIRPQSAVANPAYSVRVVSLSGVSAGTSGAAGETAAARVLSVRSAALVAGASHESRVLAARELAWRMLRWFRWRPRFQFRFLKWLWERESSWNVYAYNPYSGACGIPQAVPCDKMASAGRHYRTSAWTQVRWGLRYIRGRYGSPKRAWAHENAYGWY